MPDIHSQNIQDDTVAEEARDLLKTARGEDVVQRANAEKLIEQTAPLLERKVDIGSLPFPPDPAPVDFQFELRRGNIPGFVAANHQGHADAMGTTEQGVWGHTDDIGPAVIALYDTPAKVKMASTSTDDDSGGTGALTVQLVGYDSSNGLQIETITLDGQTEVESVNVYKAVTFFIVLTSGTGNVNAGDIWVGVGTFTAGVPATKYLFSEAGDRFARSGIAFVPAGHIHWIIQILLMIADTSKSLEIHLNVYDGSNKGIGAHFPLGSGILQTESPAIAPLNAGTLWWITGSVSTSTAAVTTIFAYDDETL
ncbi:MAG: hypothetical protein IIA64_04895 [Planctomycetes bacterium]|nr:hypothetical protein [Planctomycetota bacterium]